MQSTFVLFCFWKVVLLQGGWWLCLRDPCTAARWHLVKQSSRLSWCAAYRDGCQHYAGQPSRPTPTQGMAVMEASKVSACADPAGSGIRSLLLPRHLVLMTILAWLAAPGPSLCPPIIHHQQTQDKDVWAVTQLLSATYIKNVRLTKILRGVGRWLGEG